MTKKKTGISRRDFLKTGATLEPAPSWPPPYLAMPSRFQRPNYYLSLERC